MFDGRRARNGPSEVRNFVHFGSHSLWIKPPPGEFAPINCRLFAKVPTRQSAPLKNNWIKRHSRRLRNARERNYCLAGGRRRAEQNRGCERGDIIPRWNTFGAAIWEWIRTLIKGIIGVLLWPHKSAHNIPRANIAKRFFIYTKTHRKQTSTLWVYKFSWSYFFYKHILKAFINDP